MFGPENSPQHGDKKPEILTFRRFREASTKFSCQRNYTAPQLLLPSPKIKKLSITNEWN